MNATTAPAATNMEPGRGRSGGRRGRAVGEGPSQGTTTARPGQSNWKLPTFGPASAPAPLRPAEPGPSQIGTFPALYKQWPEYVKVAQIFFLGLSGGRGGG